MAKKIQIITGAAAIDKAIKSISTRGAKLDDAIQQAGLSILAHIEQHGDTTLADRLFDAMPKGSRRVMLAEWFVAFGMIRTLSPKNAEDKEAIAAGRHFKLDRARKTDMEGAEAKPWHDMKKQQVASDAFDAQAAVKSVLARLSAAAKAGREVQNKVEALAQARALVAALEGTGIGEELE